MPVHFETVRDRGFFLFASGGFVIYIANTGVITGSLMLILDADILIAGRLAKKLERAAITRRIENSVQLN